ncbi:MAG: Bug family tripartite tricarboxylate transporter substrate binding protein [Lautropia sp.]
MPAFADWPERPIRIVVPYPPGGLTDNAARTLSAELAQQLGQPVIVENRAGAGGKIGFDFVRRAPKDGYTIALVVPALMVLLPLTSKDFGIEPLKEFEPLSNGVDNYNMLVVHKSFGAKTLPEFVARVKEKQGRANFGNSGGPGTTFHFNAIRMLTLLGLTADDAAAIAYKGEIEAVNALMAGDIDFAITTDTGRKVIDAGQGIPIAVATAERVSVLPNLPTFRELGVDWVADGWVGFVAPAGVPTAVLDKLNTAFNRALDHPEVKQSLRRTGYIPVPGSREAFRARIEANRKTYSGMLESGAIKLDMR